MSTLFSEDIILDLWRKLREENPAMSVSEAAGAVACCVPPGPALRYAKRHRLVRGSSRERSHEFVMAGQLALAKELILEELSRERHPSSSTTHTKPAS